MRRLSVVLLAASCALALAAAQPDPGILIVNARIYTGVSSSPWAEAIEIRGDRIARVGTTAAIRASGAGARVIDAQGRLVIPGINDAHVHIGTIDPHVQLEGPPAMDHDPTLDEVLQRLRAALPKATGGEWVLGEIGAVLLDDPEATRFALDVVAPRHRVVLTSWTGHGTLINTAAMRDLGIKEDEPDPPGGFFARMPRSQIITGRAHEYAEYRLHQQRTMAPAPDAQIAALRAFTAEASRFGITSLQWMLTALPPDVAASYAAAADLPARVRIIDFPMTGLSAWQSPAAARVKADGRTTVSGTKWILDGTPVERLMFLREPYADRADTRGRMNFSPAELESFLRKALAVGEQPMFHAVGDAAIDALLAALERTGGDKWRPLRPRLEHGDMLEPSHFERARRVGLVLVQNPSHFMIPAIAGQRLGPRLARSWLLKSTIAAGVPVALGSDGPLNPFLNIMFAGIAANNPAEAMTREQALRAYTFGAAFAERQEGEKGTIAPGMLADVAMLSQDFFAVAPDALPATTSLMTIVGGRIVHDTTRSVR